MFAESFPVRQAIMEPATRFDGASAHCDFRVPLGSPAPLPTLLVASGSNSSSPAKLHAAQPIVKPSVVYMPKLPAGFTPPPGLPHPVLDSEEDHTLTEVLLTVHDSESDKSTTDASDSPIALSEDVDQLDEKGYIPGRSLRSAIAGPPDAFQPQVLELSKTIPDQAKACGCPSVGSVHHHLGLCVPCDFMHRNEACRMGAACKFCHLCGPEATKQKKKQRARALKFARRWQEAMVEHM